MTTKFRKVGSTYRCQVTDDSALWIKRKGSHAYELLHEFRQGGARAWSVLATHKTLTAALADGEALVNG